jgi:hypothetical protein
MSEQPRKAEKKERAINPGGANQPEPPPDPRKLLIDYPQPGQDIFGSQPLHVDPKKRYSHFAAYGCAWHVKKIRAKLVQVYPPSAGGKKVKIAGDVHLHADGWFTQGVFTERCKLGDKGAVAQPLGASHWSVVFRRKKWDENIIYDLKVYAVVDEQDPTKDELLATAKRIKVKMPKKKKPTFTMNAPQSGTLSNPTPLCLQFNATGTSSDPDTPLQLSITNVPGYSYTMTSPNCSNWVLAVTVTNPGTATGTLSTLTVTQGASNLASAQNLRIWNCKTGGGGGN